MIVSESSARRYVLDPDVRLMLEVRNDNAAAFEELVARYQGRLMTVLMHLVGNGIYPIFDMLLAQARRKKPSA